VATKLRITAPDDWHLHLRDGAALAATVAHSARQFARAIVMPNLVPPVTTTQAALAYRERILRAVPSGLEFEPLMTLYLTDNTTPEEIAKAAAASPIHAAKLYPAGATTNADSGVTDVVHIQSALAAMQAHGMPLLIHGEVTDPSIDVFDREKVYLNEVLTDTLDRFPNLRVVLEHITTEESVNFVRAAPKRLAATITAHHLVLNRNAMFAGGIRPHHYCLPVLKRERHRRALVQAATSGEPCFFLGTDSAPHAQTAKESSCGCAGIFTAHAALEFYAQAFAEANALERLESFSSVHGADFYGLPRNRGTVCLIRESWTVPDHYPFGDQHLVPLGAGQSLDWRLCEG
jgi:dihydroorotase